MSVYLKAFYLSNFDPYLFNIKRPRIVPGVFCFLYVV